MGIVLDEQKEDDEVIEYQGVTILVEKDLTFMFDDAVITHQKGIFGDSYEVYRDGEAGGGCQSSRS
ncbi:MAG: hypothetical protein ACERKV_12505 [Clostridiaceae bacterium]